MPASNIEAIDNQQLAKSDKNDCASDSVISTNRTDLHEGINVEASEKDFASAKQEANKQERSNDFWVFGYGSLVWKVDFPIECQQTGYIKGFVRRFYQNSIDHRGTHNKPGRVVTLLPSDDPESKVFGVAYKIPQQQTDDVIRHLDFREKNGYERHTVQFYAYPEANTNAEPVRELMIYVATKDNDSFAGHISEIEQIAKQVYEACGPSGPNREYVFRLAEAMRQLFPSETDEHLFELEEQLKQHIATNTGI